MIEHKPKATSLHVVRCRIRENENPFIMEIKIRKQTCKGGFL